MAELEAISEPNARPEPVTTLSTPAGKPASARTLASSSAMAGACEAGLSTTVFPHSNAGTSFQAGMAMGKFHGVMSDTTPSGSRRVSSKLPGKSWGMVCPPTV